MIIILKKTKVSNIKCLYSKHYAIEWKTNKPIIIDDIEYKSIGDAEIALGIKKLTIRYRILSNNFSN